MTGNSSLILVREGFLFQQPQALALIDPVTGVLSVMGMFRQQWCQLKTHRFTSWNQRVWVDV